MARFARDCLYRFSIITKQLEVQLGPGTGDLGLRIGLHSGAVTAVRENVIALIVFFNTQSTQLTFRRNVLIKRACCALTEPDFSSLATQ
jgi:hypothetical protein